MQQLKFLRQAGQPLCETQLLVGAARVTLTLRENAVVRFTLTASPDDSDYAYDYEWYNHHT